MTREESVRVLVDVHAETTGFGKMRTAVATTLDGVNPDNRGEEVAANMQTLEAVVADVKAALTADLMSSPLSDEELRGAAAWQASPVGRKYRAAMAEIIDKATKPSLRMLVRQAAALAKLRDAGRVANAVVAAIAGKLPKEYLEECKNELCAAAAAAAYGSSLTDLESMLWEFDQVQKPQKEE